MALPTFFIIGAAKAGTTSLHSYLGDHPEVQMSAVKETNFFAGPDNGDPYPVGRVERLNEYEELFDPSFAVRGEASPSYTNAPRRQGVPQRMAALVPEAKLVYLVRDPVQRLLSQYRMRVAEGKETRSIDAAVDDLDRVEPTDWLLAAQSFYARQVELYLPWFPIEQIHVVDQAELRAKRAATLAGIFSFLGVAEDFESPRFASEHFRGADRPAYPRLFRRLAVPVLSGPSKLLPAAARDALRVQVERRLGRRVPAPRPSERSLARLRELFAPDAERLRSLTGMSFASWSV